MCPPFQLRFLGVSYFDEGCYDYCCYNPVSEWFLTEIGIYMWGENSIFKSRSTTVIPFSGEGPFFLGYDCLPFTFFLALTNVSASQLSERNGWSINHRVSGDTYSVAGMDLDVFLHDFWSFWAGKLTLAGTFLNGLVGRSCQLLVLTRKNSLKIKEGWEG